MRLPCAALPARLYGKREAAGIAAFALLLGLLAIRITRGADLGDESYYAIFIDDWLKGGIATSSFLVIHQTAALLVYPAALAYAALKGSSDGLFLFLRVLFLAGAAASALCWILFLKRLGYRLLAWAGGIFVLSFVPFGLPAPSYNTLGQQALTIALASLGVAALVDGRTREQFWWLIASAAAWAVATIAYPSLIMPLGALCLLGLWVGDRCFPRPLSYAAMTGAAVCAGWSLVILSLTFARLRDSVIFTGTAFDADGWGRKLAFVQDLFAANFAFSLLCVAAIGIGVARRRFPLFARLATVAVLAALFVTAPALYARSHDAVTLAALTGLGLLSGLRTNAGRAERAIGLVYATSLLAALTTGVTASNSVFNFSIGALPAAALAVVGRPAAKSSSVAGLIAVSAAIAAVLSTSLFSYYGELPGRPDAPREHITGGFFSGLALLPDDAALLRLVQERIDPLLENKPPIAILGRLPGLILAMPTRLSMPIAYAVPGGDKWLSPYEAFYRQPGRQPLLVLIYRDRYFLPPNPIPRFDNDYALADELKTPLGRIEVFRRR
ncbi:hypothetical protein [Bradyrhizobium sp.]|jgi:hypothetical protein|uniref:hypothetical protein n=1 Tax=Bradyrhizobium sp. TaxID=376 RepID=UPI002E0BA949|nr:hypothetical protein [Bradyrhizobium sp.]